jgi:DNA-binding NarL/FixJ family response regulator
MTFVLIRLIIELAIRMARKGMSDEDIAYFIEVSPITISN